MRRYNTYLTNKKYIKKKNRAVPLIVPEGETPQKPLIYNQKYFSVNAWDHSHNLSSLEAREDHTDIFGVLKHC